MPAVYPFRAVQFAGTAGGADVSPLIAPPYDVLDKAAKDRLLARDRHNIVAIDLPHLPPKDLGPPEAYAAAAKTFRQWLADGILTRSEPAQMFLYRQTFESAGHTFQRSGMACTVDLVPFGARAGGGVLPHEETFSGPKADRLALMKATRAQLSPILSLHQDATAQATTILGRIAAARAPSVTANIGDGVLHEVWSIADNATIGAYQRSLAGEDIFIADGHHRYNTALNYLAELEAAGPIPADHPARRCLMVLVGMSDPGMVIWPTHRVLGGMQGYSWDRFLAAAGPLLALEPVAGGLPALDRALHDSAKPGRGRMGFYDFATRAAAIGRPSRPDPLKAGFAHKSEAWRALDVAIVQHLIVEQICQPALNAGRPVQWAFPHTLEEVTSMGGAKALAPQLAIILKPTPLDAVRVISRAGELMPQKSTFFYPKLATGLFMHMLD